MRRSNSMGEMLPIDVCRRPRNRISSNNSCCLKRFSGTDLPQDTSDQGRGKNGQATREVISSDINAAAILACEGVFENARVNGNR